MTTLTMGSSAAATSVITQVAHCVQELAVLAGRGCLVEALDSRLLAHHFVGEDLDPILVSALVSGSLTGLHNGLSLRRTTGLLPSGPVVEGRLAGRPVRYLALPSGGAWLLSSRSGPKMSLEALRGPIERLAALLACDAARPELSCLDGGALPADLASAERLWIARFTAAVSAESLWCALTPSGTPLRVRPLRCGEGVYVVVTGSRRSTSAHAHQAVDQVRAEAAVRLGSPVTAAISGVCEPAGLVAARNQADTAVSATQPGTCRSLEAVRSALVLRHLASALGSLPDLGTDPLDGLFEYDQRRNAALATTLRVWLNSFGDTPSATAVLGIHPNTLRYRLRRITEILGVDVRLDVAARIAIHLQLVARDTTQGV